MKAVQRGVRFGFDRLEALFDRIFGPAWNPLYHLGALGFYFFWIAVITGIYLYIVFNTSVVGAYTSIEKLTHEQWYLGGVMRSLHRYASDGMVLMMVVHMAREFALDRFRGARWFTWVTGAPIIWLVLFSGISGYLLVWDELAQYIAVATSEFLDWLPIFADPTARNFLTPDSIDDRFFTLLVFLHIFVPLFLLLVLWIHLQRVSRSSIHPPRGLAVGTFAMLLAVSFYKPALSHGPANLAKAPGVIDLDWFFLPLYPLFDRWSAPTMWMVLTGLSVVLMVLPWLPPVRRPKPAVVDLDNCNGCTRCVEDCPFGAVVMQPRTDGRPFSREAAMKPDLCVSCGICVGACPSASPFRQRSAMVTGIDLPGLTLSDLHRRVHKASDRLRGGTRVLVFGCGHGAALETLKSAEVETVTLPCIAQLPPPFIDYVLARDLADGVFITGCSENNCYHRFGNRWVDQRLAGERDPRLRARVPRERLATCWAGPAEWRRLKAEVGDFSARLERLGKDKPAQEPSSGPPDDPSARHRRSKGDKAEATVAERHE